MYLAAARRLDREQKKRIQKLLYVFPDSDIRLWFEILGSIINFSGKAFVNVSVHKQTNCLAAPKKWIGKICIMICKQIMLQMKQFVLKVYHVDFANDMVYFSL